MIKVCGIKCEFYVKRRVTNRSRKTVGLITAGWVVSPLLLGAVAYVLFRFVLKNVFYKKDPVAVLTIVFYYLLKFLFLDLKIAGT